jgi:sugar lactone lactonase YvrE
MKTFVFSLLTTVFAALVAAAQSNVPLADRAVVKLMADRTRPAVYALNASDGTRAGTLLALNATNGAVLGEAALGLNPTDMALSPGGDALYVINTGARTIMKVDLQAFTVTDTRSISTPNSYNESNPLHIGVGNSNLVFFTDGGWAPRLYTFDFLRGVNVSEWDDGEGIGGLTVTRDGNMMFTWRQYGWSAGNVNSWVTRLTINAGALTARETSFVSWRRDPFDTPLLLNDSETILFNKQQVFVATNIASLIREFSENIYSINRRGDWAFGTTKVFSTATGEAVTNLPFSTSVHTVAPNDQNIFLYRRSPSEVVVYPISRLVGAGWETNQPPVANFTRTPTNATTLTRITFDASSSTDDQGPSGLLYRWDWDNDGTLDTESSTNAVATHLYNIAGTKSVALHVKDRYGAVSTRVQTFNVVHEEDPGTPGGGNPMFELQFAASDIVFDPVRPYAYASSYDNKLLAVLNLTNGLIERQFSFEWHAEAITISPDGQKMYVALLRRPHSYYWFGGHSSYIAEFNLATLVKTKEFAVDMDPYDMAVTDGGILIISSGSDQWTDIRTYRTSNGQLLATGGIRQASRISLHPSQRAIYTADTDLSPSDIRRYDFDPVTGAFTGSRDSRYHGDYYMSGNVWCFPGGSNVLTRSGNIFTSSSVDTEDMVFVRSLAGGYLEGAAFDRVHNALFTVAENRLRYYNLATQEEVSTHPVRDGTLFVSAATNHVFTAAVTANRTYFQRQANPAMGAETNQPPIADFTRTPSNATTRTTITFDGSRSRDDQGGGTALQYRWDWENDGVFDTTFTNNASTTHRYNIAGTKTAALEVRDRYGALNRTTQTFNVVPEDDPGTPGGGNPMFELQFAATDIAFDPVRPYAYASSYDNKLLAVLNLTNGLIERQFSFEWNPESITVSPDGQRMYVALLRRPHSSYWFGGHLSYIAEFNLATLVKTKEFDIDMDPYDLAVTDGGILIIPSGSDQWTDIRTYRTSDGQRLSTTGIRQASRISLHPSQRAIYAADTDSSPSDIRRYEFDPVTGAFAGSWDSPYHGDYYMSGNVWCFPSGSNVLTRSGNIFTSSSLQSQDMRFVRSLAGGAVEGVAFDPAHDALFAVNGTQLRHHGLTTGELLWSQNVSSGTRYVHATSRDLYLARVDAGRTIFQRMANPALPEPVVIAQPESQTVAAGGWVSFSIGVRGATPFSYQWFFENQPIAAASGATLLLNNVQRANEGAYFVVVSNRYGSVTSAIARLTILVPPDITQQPASLSVPEGSDAVITVQATGTAPLRYQWNFEGTTIPGATNAILVLQNVRPWHGGAYRVQVSNAAGSVFSSSAIVRVTPTPAVILSGPLDRTVVAGEVASFNVVASGSAPVSFQWQHNGAVVPGVNNPLLVISNAQASHAGDYRVIVANDLGRATSSVARLTVTPSVPVFVLHPRGTATSADTNSLVLSSLARGTEPIDYRWRLNGTNLLNATFASLVLSNLSPAQSGNYTVVASNALGLATSAVATVTITGAPPFFVQQPLASRVDAGGPFMLTARALGSEPLSYQWRFRGTNLPGATSRTLSVTNATPEHAGPYFVVASNAYGVATSALAQVTVIVPLRVVAGLTNLAVDEGDDVLLSVTAEGTPPLSFSWQFNGLQVASGSNLLLRAVQLANAGTYRVVVANQHGSVASRMHLTVFPRAGTLAAWGDDTAGQSAGPAGAVNIVKVAGGDFHSLALRRDGSIEGWGYDGDGQASAPPALSNAVGIAAGAGHSLAIGLDGRVFAWGRNDYGQAQVPNSATSVVAIAAGEAHSVAVRQDGSVVVWGDNTLGQHATPLAPGFVTAVAAGRNHTVALRNNGTVFAWGLNSHGQCSVPAGLNNVSAVAAGYLHSLALRGDGSVVAWGDNSYGQASVPPGLSNVIAIAAGELHSLALRGDGSVVAWGDDAFEQSTIPASLGFVSAIGAGYYHNLAVVPPALSFAKRADGLVLWWEGECVLQQASSPMGPFEDVAATSPCTNLWSAQTSARFFRLRPAR